MWICKKCNEESEDTFDSCWNCGTDVDGSVPQNPHEFIAAKSYVPKKRVVVDINQARIAEINQRIVIAQKQTDGSFSVKSLLTCLIGEQIGINVNDPDKVTAALLTDVHEDHFVVEIDGTLYHIPLSQIIRIARSSSGVKVSGVFSGQIFPVIVKVFDLVIYKGGIGVGIGIGGFIDN